MPSCIFCEIAAGALAADVVHETADAVGFLDRHPSARGHVLVIPRLHAPTLLDLEGGSIGGLFVAVQEVMRKVEAALRPVAFHVGWNHGAAAGQHVFHQHVHVLPQYGNRVRPVQMLGEGGDARDLAALAAAIRSA